MKNIFIMFLVLGFVGCSTSSKKEEQTEDFAPVITEAPRPAKETSKSSKRSEELVIPPIENTLPPVQSQYAELNEAVKSQSDEKMYQAAAGILYRNPTDLKALNAMGMYHYKKGRFDLAEYMLRKAIGANSVVSELHNNLGVVLLAKGERREAIFSFRKALEINMDDGVAAANVGALYVAERDYSKARVALETAYRRGIRDNKVLTNYGVALAASGKNEKAEEMYSAVLKSNPNDKEALFNYSILLIEGMGKYSEGLEVISRLKFVGGPADTRSRINALENKAKTGLK